MPVEAETAYWRNKDRNRDSFDSGICQKPLHASRHEKYVACEI